eukprot:scaffold90622_cov19-Prasinocladus_malaysianus.AAC.1
MHTSISIKLGTREAHLRDSQALRFKTCINGGIQSQVNGAAALQACEQGILHLLNATNQYNALGFYAPFPTASGDNQVFSGIGCSLVNSLPLLTRP